MNEIGTAVFKSIIKMFNENDSISIFNEIEKNNLWFWYIFLNKWNKIQIDF